MSLFSKRKFRKVLVFQHVPFEPLGTLDPLLRDAGFRVRYVNFSREPHAQPNIENYAGLIVLGGPMNVDQIETYPNLATEIEFIRHAIDLNLPVLGICLGAQLVAKALGAAVIASPIKEIGWYKVATTSAGQQDPVVGCFAPQEYIFQWHGDTFQLPEGAVHLARSEACTNQAFRHGDRVYGFQFHLEANEPLINRWLTVPLHIKELESLVDLIDPHEIRVQTQSHIRLLEALSKKTFGEFLKLFGSRKRRRLLMSR